MSMDEARQPAPQILAHLKPCRWKFERLPPIEVTKIPPPHDL